MTLLKDNSSMTDLLPILLLSGGLGGAAAGGAGGLDVMSNPLILLLLLDDDKNSSLTDLLPILLMGSWEHQAWEQMLESAEFFHSFFSSTATRPTPAIFSFHFSETVVSEVLMVQPEVSEEFFHFSSSQTPPFSPEDSVEQLEERPQT